MTPKQKEIIIKKLNKLIDAMGKKSFLVKTDHCGNARRGDCNSGCMTITLHNIETDDYKLKNRNYLINELNAANQIWKQIKEKKNT